MTCLAPDPCPIWTDAMDSRRMESKLSRPRASSRARLCPASALRTSACALRSAAGFRTSSAMAHCNVDTIVAMFPVRWERGTGTGDESQRLGTAGVYISRTIFLKRKRDPINSGTMNPVRYHGTRNVNLYGCGEQLAGRDRGSTYTWNWLGWEQLAASSIHED